MENDFIHIVEEILSEQRQKKGDGKKFKQIRNVPVVLRAADGYDGVVAYFQLFV